MHIAVDWDLCESNGLCEDAAPQVFSLGDDDMLTVHDDQVHGSERAALHNAVMSCPKQAIRLIE